MQVLFDVVEDLYIFAVSALFPSWRDQKDKRISLYLPASQVISSFREPIEIDIKRTLEPVVADKTDASIERAPRPSSINEVVDQSSADASFFQKHMIMYCTQPQVALRTAPQNATDTAIATVSYGDMVMVLGMNDTWVHVVVGDRRGYMPTAALAPDAASVYPTFVIGEANEASTTNTIRLRSVIRDEFSASLSQLPLQAHEYVYYRLLRRGARIAWPDIRPRTPGSWAKILGTLENAVVSDEPSVGAVMEYALPEETTEGSAHLAYVEKVFHDCSIQISEADWPDRGAYNERVLVEAEWKAFAPSFITVN